VGAVGTALVSGGPLVAVGQVHGTANTVRALLGLLIVLAGVGLAIWFTSQVLVPRLTTPGTILTSPELKKLRDKINAEPAEYMGVAAESVSGLFDRQKGLRQSMVSLSRQLGKEHDPQRKAVLQDAFGRLVEQEETVSRYVRWLLALGHAWLIRAALERSRVATLGGGVIVAVGAVLFFTATSSGPTYVPVLAPSPTATASPASVPSTTPAAP
jgi:hypothetical protein